MASRPLAHGGLGGGGRTLTAIRLQDNTLDQEACGFIDEIMKQSEIIRLLCRWRTLVAQKSKYTTVHDTKDQQLERIDFIGGSQTQIRIHMKDKSRISYYIIRQLTNRVT